ncbi:MAG: hypothetical protein QM680_13600 [Luteolibacter sp.]
MKAFLAIALLASATLPTVKKKPLTTRETIWRDIEPAPEKVLAVEQAVTRYGLTKSRYEKVAKGIPPAVIFVFHMRESTWSFAKHLHEGSPLTGRTKWVPVGRPKAGNPPFTWEESARDALYVVKSYDAPTKWTTVDATLDWIERFNGLGYRNKGLRSPYIVGGSNLQQPGKYVADGKFSKTAWDGQLGCATVLKALAKRGYYTPPIS